MVRRLPLRERRRLQPVTGPQLPLRRRGPALLDEYQPQRQRLGPIGRSGGRLELLEDLCSGRAPSWCAAVYQSLTAIALSVLCRTQRGQAALPGKKYPKRLYVVDCKSGNELCADS